MSQPDRWWIGVILVVIGSACTNIGGNLISLSYHCDGNATGKAVCDVVEGIVTGGESVPPKDNHKEENITGGKQQLTKVSSKKSDLAASIRMEEGGATSRRPSKQFEDRIGYRQSRQQLGADYKQVPSNQVLQVTMARTIENAMSRMLSTHEDDDNSSTTSDFVYDGGVIGSSTYMQVMAKRLRKKFPKIKTQTTRREPEVSETPREGGQKTSNIVTTDIIKKKDRSDTIVSGNSASKDQEREMFDLDKAENDERSAHQRFLWTIGLLISIPGILLTFAAYGFGPQSLLAALAAVKFLTTIIFKYLVHKEVITKRVFIAAMCITCGCFLVVIFSTHNVELLDTHQIYAIYASNTGFHVYIGVGLAAAIGLTIVFRLYNHSRVVLTQSMWQHETIEPLSFVLSSAIIGTQAVVQFKTVSMLVQLSFIGINQFMGATIWVTLVVGMLFYVFWASRVNFGLIIFPPLYINPVLEVHFILFAVICGGIFYSEFTDFTAQEYIGFVIGIILILSGVYLLAPPESIPRTNNQENVSDV